MIIELLSHCTPPSCIPANILTIDSMLHPKENKVKELMSVGFVRDCRGPMTVTTKTLAAYDLAKVDNYQQLFSDETPRKQT